MTAGMTAKPSERRDQRPPRLRSDVHVYGMTTMTWTAKGLPVISVRVPADRWLLLNELARRSGVSRSELIRRALARLTDEDLRALAAA